MGPRKIFLNPPSRPARAARDRMKTLSGSKKQKHICLFRFPRMASVKLSDLEKRWVVLPRYFLRVPVKGNGI
jgi:hypothetical protein